MYKWCIVEEYIEKSIIYTNTSDGQAFLTVFQSRWQSGGADGGATWGVAFCKVDDCRRLKLVRNPYKFKSRAKSRLQGRSTFFWYFDENSENIHTLYIVPHWVVNTWVTTMRCSIIKEPSSTDGNDSHLHIDRWCRWWCRCGVDGVAHLHLQQVIWWKSVNQVV